MRFVARVLVGALVLPGGLLGLPADAGAQGYSAALEITVVSADDGRPLRGAHVVLERLGLQGFTDAGGLLRLEKLPAGARVLTIEVLGYARAEQIVTLNADETTRVLARLDFVAIALRTICARGRSLLTMRGFFDRKQSGNGTFLTRTEIQDLNASSMSEVLRRVTGIVIGEPKFSRVSAQIRGASSIRHCPIQYFIDGTLTAEYNTDDIPAQDVEGIEIYRGGATVPARYNQGTAMCGAILVWTRAE